MAHKLHISEAGVASFASAKQAAWHGLGQILDHQMTSEEAIENAGLNYEVEKFPNVVAFGDEHLATNSSFSTVRLDTKVVLGDKLGGSYEVVQNKDAFKFFDAIVGEGEAIYETAGALGQGEIIFITAKLPDYIRVGNGDDITERYLLLMMGHDGTCGIQAMFTPIRVVCNNTLQGALRSADSKVSIRHTKSVHSNLLEAHKALGIANKLTLELNGIYNQMAKVRITDVQLRNYIDNIFLTQQEILDLRKGASDVDVLSTRKRNIRNGVLDFAYAGVGQSEETAKGTLWGAYNGITGYFANTKNFKTESDKFKSLVMGGAANTMQQAFVNAVALIN
jgi:phage/plasmid-like protein (TIGR03299 family)